MVDQRVGIRAIAAGRGRLLDKERTIAPDNYGGAAQGGRRLGSVLERRAPDLHVAIAISLGWGLWITLSKSLALLR